MAPGVPGAMQGQQQGEEKGLWRLGAEQTIARHGGVDTAGGRSLQCVCYGQGRDGAGHTVEGCQQGGDGAGRDDGPGRILDQNDIWRVGCQGFEAEAHAVLSGCAAGNGRENAEALQGFGERSGVADRLKEVDMREQGFGGPSNDRFAAQGRKLLGLPGAEAGAGAGGDEKSGGSHCLRPMLRRNVAVNPWLGDCVATCHPVNMLK